MRKIFILLTICVLCILLNSCGKKDNLEGLTPDPNDIFDNAEITVFDDADGDHYIFEIAGVDIDDFSTYVEKSKNNFNNKGFDSECDFGAYTDDGKYWLEAHYKDNVITVHSNKSKKYDKN